MTIEQTARFRVLLIEQGEVSVAHECDSRSEANAWVEEWDRDPMAVAVVWPAWAPIQLLQRPKPPAALFRQTVYYVLCGERILAKYFEADRAQRFADNFNLMDGTATAVVVAAELVGHDVLRGVPVPAVESEVVS